MNKQDFENSSVFGNLRVCNAVVERIETTTSKNFVELLEESELKSIGRKAAIKKSALSFIEEVEQQSRKVKFFLLDNLLLIKDGNTVAHFYCVE